MSRGVYRRQAVARPPKFCTVDGCGKIAVGPRCPMHHARWYRTGTVDPSPRRVATPRLRIGRLWSEDRHRERQARLGTPISRLLANVEYDTAGGCWLWTGDASKAGYGRWKLAGRRGLAHRLSWEIHRGAIPPGLLVMHRCDTPPCVNPTHLSIGTQRDNMLDCMSKGRHRPGSQPRLDGATDRTSMTRARRRRVFAGCDGRCECGADLAVTGYEVDHQLPLALGGPEDDGNLRALCPPCHRLKTAADQTRISKTKRMRKLRLDVPREPSKHPLKGRGFDETRTRGFDGKVRERDR